jgi:hypothetical protein
MRLLPVRGEHPDDDRYRHADLSAAAGGADLRAGDQLPLPGRVSGGLLLRHRHADSDVDLDRGDLDGDWDTDLSAGPAAAHLRAWRGARLRG